MRKPSFNLLMMELRSSESKPEEMASYKSLPSVVPILQGCIYTAYTHICSYPQRVGYSCSDDKDSNPVPSSTPYNLGANQ